VCSPKDNKESENKERRRQVEPEGQIVPAWLSMPVMLGLVIILATAGLVTGILAWNSGSSQPTSVQLPASISECVPDTLKLISNGELPTPDIVKFSKEHCYSLIRSQELLNNFYIIDLGYAQQYRTNPVLLWLVVGVTISGVILAALQLLASYQLAISRFHEMDGGGEMSLKRDQIALKSSVTGLFILLMSFAFFLVFVFYVYRIEPPRGQFRTLDQTQLLPDGKLDAAPAVPQQGHPMPRG
jgi:hypothetical protein